MIARPQLRSPISTAKTGMEGASLLSRRAGHGRRADHERTTAHRTAGAATAASQTFYAGRGFPRNSAGQGSQAGIRSGRPRLRLSALYRARDISTQTPYFRLEEQTPDRQPRLGLSSPVF